ncbi:MAG TPA: DedA family protein [Steroidobacteraceae bacterium]|jgi:membrane-associated protein|nr:DedA family protein [Steroidobacteraceae bacterium]
MEWLQPVIDFGGMLYDVVMHLDRHLVELVSNYHSWVYLILFAIIFAETGLVITPFLPGDSLLFAVGALAAVDTSGTLHAGTAFALLAAAAILGNTVNYSVGAAIGPRAFSGNVRFLKVEYLRRTEQFFDQHGGKTIILSRFVPIIRTCAPFVAGIGHMRYTRFQLHNCIGGIAWVALFIFGGYLFGNIPLVRNNFGVVTLLIIAVSLVPVVITFARRTPQP